ncbi:uncharacterized protein PG986_010697 [Apiospora aurea]|uniref:BTB domain-containing protein n=1 Tax=Apiospora aurea TaxID=335848 RepID=A0ABR1Q3G6_9PEZI
MSIRRAPDTPFGSALAKRVKTSHERNSFFNDPIVKIEVDDGDNGRRTWHLHRAPLVEQSRDFENRLTNGDDTIFLGGTSAETVETFSKWIYTRSLDVAELRLGLYDLAYLPDPLPNFGGMDDDEEDEEDGEDSDSDYPSHDLSDIDSPSSVYWTDIFLEDHNYNSTVSDDSVTLAAASPPLVGDSVQHAPTTPTPTDQSDSDAAALSLSHPVDRVTIRLLELYAFAQQYAIPHLQNDVMSRLENFRQSHRAERPQLGFEVIRHACNSHGGNEQDELWQWLVRDFSQSALDSPADVDRMCRELPSAFWRCAFKAKLAWINTMGHWDACETDAVDYLKAQLADDAAERGMLQATQAGAQDERLGELEEQLAVEETRVGALQMREYTDADAIRRLEARCQNLAEARDVVQDLLDAKGAELASLKASASAESAELKQLRDARDFRAEQCADLAAQLRTVAEEHIGARDLLKEQAVEIGKLRAERDHSVFQRTKAEAETRAVVEERDVARAKLEETAVELERLGRIESEKEADAAAENTVYLQSQAVSIAAVRDRLVSLADARVAEAEKLQAQAAADAEQIEKLKAKVGALRSTRDGLKADLASTSEQRDSLQSWLDNQAEQLGQLQLQAAADAEEKGDLLIQVRAQAEQICKLHAQAFVDAERDPNPGESGARS